MKSEAPGSPDPVRPCEVKRRIRSKAKATKPSKFKPVYDAHPDRRTLCFRGRVIRRFVGRASIQEVVLAAFQALEWELTSIANPIGERSNDARKSLENAVQNLTKAQDYLVFSVCGSGTAIALEDQEEIEKETNLKGT